MGDSSACPRRQCPAMAGSLTPMWIASDPITTNASAKCVCRK
ncbi:hypothetical protein BC477_02820 [Clavibacter michiganensis subsp. michiganensis]|uniref:Uncharacterized protein n=1 Tax=Clavibacter michiganensis subsp. michiganensis TaxID=33013 RepID=A0A251XJE6_CLAMM|nr:hypothetical protein BC477_02820 [Clavibacter michiganensis subsp. michiganensis]OUE03644.1 hypothetical protein CMMCAS07_01755 [Clavibacter michiganensis subsp. michiganensis]